MTRRGTQFVVRAACLVAALLVIVPWQGNFDRLGDARDVPVPSAAARPGLSMMQILGAGAWWRVEPDYSFFLVQHLQIAKRAPWRLVTAMGPLAFLYRGWHPQTGVLLLIVWVALAALYWRTLEVVGGDADERVRLAWIVAVLFVISVAPRDVVLLTVPLLAAVVYFKQPERRTAVLWLLSIASALASLTKLSSLGVAVVAFGAIAAAEIARKRVPYAPIAFLASLFVLFVAFGNRPGDFAAVIGGGLKSGRIFAESYSLQSAPIAPAVAMFLGVGVVLVLLLRSEPLHLLAALGVAAAYAKASFIRADEYHALLAPATAMALLVLYAVRIRHRGLMAAAVAVALVVCAPRAMPALDLARNARAMLLPAMAYRESAAAFENEMAGIRARNPMPQLRGRVDWLGIQQSIPIAWGLDYAPRPVPVLSLGDAAMASDDVAFYRSAGAPSWVFFRPVSLDNRYPAAEDSVLWLEMLARYDVAGFAGTAGILRRRDHPRSVVLRPLGASTIELGQRVVLPPQVRGNDAVWATVDVRPSLSGSLQAVFAGLPPLFLQVEFPDRSVRLFRLAPSIARAGFLLSPYIDSAATFAALSAGRGELLDARRLTSVAIVTKSPQAFRPDVAIRLWTLHADEGRP